MSEREAPEQESASVDRLSDEELANLLGAEDAPAPESDEPEQDSQDEGVGDDVDSEEVDEADGGEVAAEPSGTEEAEGDQSDQGDTEEDDVRVGMDYFQSELKRLESHLGRESGRAGFLQQQLAERDRQIEELRKQLSERSSGSDWDAGESPQPRPTPQQPRQVDPNTTFLVQQAAKLVTQQFLSERSDLIVDGEDGQKVYDPEFLGAVEKYRDEISAIIQSNNAIDVANRTRSILESAANDAAASRKRKLYEERLKRRADSASRLRKQKKAAAISSSEGASAKPKTKSLPADPRKWSKDDLTNAIQSMEGEY